MTGVEAGSAAGVASRVGGAPQALPEHPDRDSSGSPSPASGPVSPESFERLRTWRWERAEGKPAYTVASNAVLEEVLRRRPQSIAALIQIRGIGPAFCEKHGESLLAELAQLSAGTADAIAA